MVTAGADDLNGTRLDVNHGDVKGSAPEVINQHHLLLRGGDGAISNGGRSRLIDDLADIVAGNFTGLTGGFPLVDAKIRWTGNHHVRNLFIHILFSVLNNFPYDKT